MIARAFIGIGSNLGDRAATIDAALAALGRLEGTRVVAVSSLYETEPVGPPQPAYLNGAAALDTTLSPEHLLARLLEIERALGRVRTSEQRNGPRSIDLDLLLHGDARCVGGDLELPHPRMAERAFVLVPLAEIAPQLHHPATGVLLASLPCARLPAQGVAVWRRASAQMNDR